jgi:putative ABC transport system permease protein
MARSFSPDGENPIGRNVRLAMLEEQDFEVDPWVRIIGVVADSRNVGPREETAPEVFVPFTLTVPDGSLGLAIRTRSDPSAALPTIRSRITAAVPRGEVQLREIRTLKDEIAIATAQERFTTVLLCVFATLGIALAAIGIYGVMSYSVAQRTHEFGLRMALGADGAHLLKQILGRGLVLGSVGVMIGLVAALGLTRIIESQLYGVTPTDPATLLAVSLVLIGVALLASYIPAHRATKVDPTVALRYE